METNIDNKIASRLDLRDVVSRANEVLHKSVGTAPHPPKATWELSENGDKTKPVALKLEYFDQTSSTPFSLEELSKADDLFFRLFRVWGRLIVQNTRATTNNIIKTLGELREDWHDQQ